MAAAQDVIYGIFLFALLLPHSNPVFHVVGYNTPV